MPDIGLILVNVGGGGNTLNACALLVPPGVVTVTLRVPNTASTAIPNVAVALVELVTMMLLTVIPDPALTLNGTAKFVPVNVTLTLVP
jgi:hypothetical protein